MKPVGIPPAYRAAQGGRGEDGEVRAMRRLWQCVLLEMVKSAAGAPTVQGAETKYPAKRRIVDSARDWIATRHFREVAELAGFDGEAAQARALRLVADGFPQVLVVRPYRSRVRKVARAADNQERAA